MSALEKIIRAVIIFIACGLMVVCLYFIIDGLQLENYALERFLNIAGSIAIGFICGNSINNTLCLPSKEDKE